MSDVIVSTNDPITTVTTTDNLVEIAITDNPVQVSASTAGVQGASYNQGDPIYVTVRNATGATLPKGSIVYTSGANGVHTQVSLASAASDATSARSLGWLAEDIANNADGLCMVEGYLDGIDTQGIAQGSQLYLSGTVPGGFTATKPQAPIHLVYVGVSAKASAGNGRVYVKVQNGYELDEIHDVLISNPVNNQVLTYDSATDLWINATNPADGVTSITATAPLTGGTITSTGSIGLDQTALSITQSQVTNLVSDLANTAKLNTANTFSVGGHVINNAATGTVPIRVNAIAGQTANLFEIRDSAATNYVAVNSVGSILFGGNSGSFLSGANGRVNVQLSGDNIGLTVRAFGSQTANLLQLQNSSGGVIGGFTAPVNNVSRLNLGGTDLGATLGISVHASGGVGQVIRGAAGQSVDYWQVQNSAGGVLAKVDSVGDITARVLRSQLAARIATNDVNVAPMVISTVAGQVSNNTEWQTNTGVVASVNALGYFAAPFFDATVTNAGLPAFRGRLASAQTGDGLQILNNASQILSGFANDGRFVTGITGSGFTALTSAALGQASIYARSAATVGAVVRGATSQTADLQQWQTSDGTVRAFISAFGLFATGSPAAILLNSGGGNSRVSVSTVSTLDTGITIRGVASQTANLQEWQNSAGTVLARVSSSGQIVSTTAMVASGDVVSTGGSVKAFNGLVTLGGASAGGFTQMTRSTSAQANPGANIGTLYFRDGTNAGTLRLVVRAGASGAETTILDNIPQ